VLELQSEPSQRAERSVRNWRQTGGFASETTMLNLYRPYLPPEILDHTADLLHDKRESLRRCCLVSKPWFYAPENTSLPISSFAPRLFSSCGRRRSGIGLIPLRIIFTPEDVTAADAERGGWIRSVSGAVRLGVHSDPVASLIPFHGFSPA